ncbi:hypothetical protein KIPB_017252, partial [Kipferlia bialata]
ALLVLVIQGADRLREAAPPSDPASGTQTQETMEQAPWDYTRILALCLSLAHVISGDYG